MTEPKKGKKEKGSAATGSALHRKPVNYEELEKEFEHVLNELLTDDNLQQFKQQYERLHTALVSSHENEKQLMGKVRELNEEIASNAEKVAVALSLSKEDEARIVSLMVELEAAWKKVEYMKQRETSSNETIEALRVDIENLKKLVERGADLAQQYVPGATGSAGVDNVFGPTPLPFKKIEKEKEVYEEKEKEKVQIDGLQKSIQVLTSENDRLNQMLAINMEDMREKIRDLQREKRLVFNLQSEGEHMKADVEALTAERNQAKRQQELLTDKLDKFTLEHMELRIRYELCTKDVDMLNTRLHKLQTEMDKHICMVEALQMEITEQNDKVRQRDEKLAKLNENLRRVTKAKELLTRKNKMLSDQRAALRMEKEMLHGQLAGADKTIEQNKKTKEADEKHISQLMRERDVCNKNYVKQVKATEKQARMVNLHERTTDRMGQEIMAFNKEAEKQRRLIQHMEEERDRFINQNGELTFRLLKATESIQMRENRILDQRKQLEELESTIKIQKNLFEAIHHDRNMYSRQLIETQDEMKEMRSKLRVLEYQSNSLKEEVAAREAAVVKEHLECLRLEKERDGLQGEIQMLKRHVQEVQQVIADLRAEEMNLQKVIANSDELINRQKRELDTVIRERDILGSQLVRRNDELSLLYQKVHLLEIFINNGNKKYDERIEDIRLLRLETKRQRHQNRCLQKWVANVSSYKQELYSVHREVLHERARCAALETELAQPRQIHRWRGLEVTDPSKFELLLKVQAMQKRLIMRTEEIVQLERLLQDKDRLYLDLQVVLHRQPGPEVVSQISIYQKVIRGKNRQLKSLVAEHNMDRTEMKMFDYDTQKLQLEITDLKKKYFREKKRRQELEEFKRYIEGNYGSIKGLTRAVRLPSFTAMKAAGGGFMLKQ